MQLAFDPRLDRHPMAPFLRSEVHRAIVLDDNEHREDIAGLNVWVTYQVDGRPAESRLLVHPDDHVADDLQLSVLSPTGAALIGIRAGDRMPFASADGHPHFVTPLAVGRKVKRPAQTRASRRQPDVPRRGLRHRDDGTQSANPTLNRAYIEEATDAVHSSHHCADIAHRRAADMAL
jgi:hypothetical protein